MLSFDGNTSPYLQYAHARICSIFRRSDVSRPLRDDIPFIIEHAEEALLARRLVNFSAMVDESLHTYSPHRLCTYLHSVASAFASFYESCPVLSTGDDEIRMSRLALCDLTARTLSSGLTLLGIDCPEQM